MASLFLSVKRTKHQERETLFFGTEGTVRPAHFWEPRGPRRSTNALGVVCSASAEAQKTTAKREKFKAASGAKCTKLVPTYPNSNRNQQAPTGTNRNPESTLMKANINILGVLLPSLQLGDLEAGLGK